MLFTKLELKLRTRENLNAIFYFVFLFIISFGSVLFSFRSSNVWQILISASFIMMYLGYFALTVYEITRSKVASDAQLITIICCNLMMLWIILLNQIGGVTSIAVKFKVILATSLLAYFIYQFLHWGIYLRIFFKDKILRIFTTVALFITVFGLVYFFAAQISIILKIGLGVDFILLVYAIINAIFYTENRYFKPEDRETFIYKLITISLYAVAIFLFPYYLKWCGLDEQSFNIFIPVYSYVVGGMLTLGGVAWTIRKSEIDKKVDDIKRSKPVVFIYDKDIIKELGDRVIERAMFSNQVKGTLERALNNEKAFMMPEFVISNSDYSHVAVKGFKINDDYHLFDIVQVLPKNTTVRLKNNFRFRFDEPIEHVSIILQDMIDYDYELEVNFDIIDDRLDVHINVVSAIRTHMIELSKLGKKK